VLIVFTFCAHGLYAVGYYSVPQHFVFMSSSILHISDAHARQFLMIMGVMDFVTSAMIFHSTEHKHFLRYAALWGLLTALARTLAFVHEMETAALRMYFYETLYRLPHAILPFLVARSKK